jgi:hypothetical protein
MVPEKSGILCLHICPARLGMGARLLRFSSFVLQSDREAAPNRNPTLLQRTNRGSSALPTQGDRRRCALQRIDSVAFFASRVRPALIGVGAG